MSSLDILAAWGVPELHRATYATAATVEEMREAYRESAAGYMTARVSGILHVDALDAYRAGAQMGQYAAARKEGATHREALDAYRDGILGEYSIALSAGATDGEFREALELGVDPSEYVGCRIWRATHAEALAAYDAAADLDQYAMRREAGDDHVAALALSHRPED